MGSVCTNKSKRQCPFGTTKRYRPAQTHSTLSDSVPNQPKRLLDVLHLDPLRESHTRMSFRKTNHAFQLSSGGGNPPLLRSNVFSDLAHLDVRLDEGVRGFFGQDGVNSRPSIGDVGGQGFDGL
jgi:hypothetical protein